MVGREAARHLPQRLRQLQPALGCGASHPGIGMLAPMDHAHDGYDCGEFLEVDAVRETIEQHAPQPALYDGEPLGRLADPPYGIGDLGEEGVGRTRTPHPIPLECEVDLAARHGANAQRAHSAQTVAELPLDDIPRLALLRLRVGLGLAARQLCRQGRRDWRHDRSIQAVPELPDERDALVGGQLLEVEAGQGHGRSLAKTSSERNGCSCHPNDQGSAAEPFQQDGSRAQRDAIGQWSGPASSNRR